MFEKEHVTHLLALVENENRPFKRFFVLVWLDCSI